MNYELFCHLADRKLTLRETKAWDRTTATEKEVDWRKGYQVRRAARKFKKQIPLPREQLYLLEDKTKYQVTAQDYRKARAMELLADSDNADKYFPLTEK